MANHISADEEESVFGSISDGASVKVNNALIVEKGIAKISILSFKNLPSITYLSEMVSEVVSIKFYNSVGSEIEIKDLSEEYEIEITIPYNLSSAKNQKKYHASAPIGEYYFDEKSAKWKDEGLEPGSLDAVSSNSVFETTQLSDFSVVLGAVAGTSSDHSIHQHPVVGGETTNVNATSATENTSSTGGGCSYTPQMSINEQAGNLLLMFAFSLVLFVRRNKKKSKLKLNLS